jgi:hypothetical protein
MQRRVERSDGGERCRCSTPSTGGSTSSTYSNDAANVLYHVVNERQICRRAMIFTTNKHPSRWVAVLHDDDLAEAIVDRILERGRLLRLDGPSLRTRHLPADELADTSTGRRVPGIQAAEFPEPSGRLRLARAIPN